jgi:twitching motility two-component system response regulator PilH
LARKILLADDSVTAQNMGRKILADAGYEVITVNNGSAALKKISEAKPDVIVLDVYMPGYSGLEVCQRLKETGDTARIPILLTVGKLEPFKPEEAKRARADAFIVKPFEASELLSALSKLEDKIVPRAESSKPGRFARTIAIVEEGRYDSTMAAQEDSSWKNRIAFPSKKKKNADAEDVDDPAIYNPVNKDLRTVIERKPSEASQAQAPESTVDVAALAEHGLPKDVTPEEIAALAAAAAQIKGTMAGDQSADSAPLPEQKTEEGPQAPQPEIRAQEKLEEKIEAQAEEKKLVEAKLEERKQEETRLDEAKPTRNQETKIEAAANQEKFEAYATRESDAPAVAVAKAFEVLQRFAEKPFSSVSEAIPADLPSMAAHDIAAAPESSSFASHSQIPSAEPVTMAVAASAEHAPMMSRWAAVSATLLPEESTVSLEQEMQKACGVPADATPVPTIGPRQETFAVEAPADSPTSFSISAPESVSDPAIGNTAAPELQVRPAEQASSPAADFSASQPWRTEVASFPAQASEGPGVGVSPVETSVVEVMANESNTQPDARREESAFVEGVPEPATVSQSVPVAEIFSPASEQDGSSQRPIGEETRSEEIRSEDRQSQSLRSDENRAEAPAQGPEAQSDRSTAELAHESHSTTEPVTAGISPEGAPATEATATPAGTVEAEPPASPVAASGEPVKTETQPVQKESEIAATTAAAWASWRRIRESGDPKVATPPASADDKSSSEPQNTAAMAVAAGAERAPEEAAAPSNSDPADSESGDIANIVDSVLADLRPKIVAEISKKMGKKK